MEDSRAAIEDEVLAITALYTEHISRPFPNGDCDRLRSTTGNRNEFLECDLAYYMATVAGYASSPRRLRERSMDLARQIQNDLSDVDDWFSELSLLSAIEFPVLSLDMKQINEMRSRLLTYSDLVLAKASDRLKPDLASTYERTSSV